MVHLKRNGVEDIQPKLKIGRPNDRYEREADRVADAVMRMPDLRAKMQTKKGSEQLHMQPLAKEDLQMKQKESGAHQMCPTCREKASQGQPMNCPECEKKLQMSPAMPINGNGQTEVSPEFSRRILATSGQGAPLSPVLNREMSHKIGADFSDVKIHTGQKSKQMNEQLGAKAFTYGNNIYFNHGQYSPASQEGKHLLAHELTHVIQQKNKIQPMIQRSVYVEDLTPRDIRMSASLRKFVFYPPPGAVYREGNTRLQVFDLALIKLLGADWYDGLAEEVLPVYEERYNTIYGEPPSDKGYFQSTSTAGEGEQMVSFIIFTTNMQVLLQVLQDEFNLRPNLSENQLGLVELGVATQSLWKRLGPVLVQEHGFSWYKRYIFDREMARNASLLRRYSRATSIFSSQTSEDVDELVDEILEALLRPAELVNTMRDEIEPIRNAEKENLAILLGYIRTQQDIYETALNGEQEEAREARVELAERFIRYTQRLTADFFGLEEQLSDTPSPYTDPPIPASISASPSLGSDKVAASGAIYRFSMNLHYDHWTTAFNFSGLYSFVWYMYKLQPEQSAEEAEPEDSRSISSMSEVLQARFDQVDENYEEDRDNSEVLAWINHKLRTAGTVLGQVTDEATMPRSELLIQIPEEPGHYVFKCVAHQSAEGETLLRAPSQAFVRFISRDIEDISTEDVQTTIDARTEIENIERQLREEDLTDEERTAFGIQKRLLQQMVEPTTENLEQIKSQMSAQIEAAFPELRSRISRLEEEIETLQSQSNLTSRQRDTLQQKEYQLRQLQSSLETLLRLDPETSTMQRKLESIQQIIEMQRERRTEVGDQTWVPLRTTFTSDQGVRLGLNIEYYTQSTEEDGNSRIEVYLSDLTTPNSGQNDQDNPGRGDTLQEAIGDAIVKLLENESNYGRGVVAYEVEGSVHTREIEAGTGRILVEAFEGLAMIGTLAAIVAAPLTGGASLYLLIPLGLASAGFSLYRIYERADNDVLRLDAQTVMDIVDIVGGMIGLAEVTVGIRATMLARTASGAAQAGRAGQAARAAQSHMRAVRMGDKIAILGMGADGAGVLLLGAGVANQILALNDPSIPEGEKRSRLLQILGRAFVDFGTSVGQHLVSAGSSGSDGRTGDSSTEATTRVGDTPESSSSRETGTEQTGERDVTESPSPAEELDAPTLPSQEPTEGAEGLSAPSTPETGSSSSAPEQSSELTSVRSNQRIRIMGDSEAHQLSIAFKDGQLFIRICSADCGVLVGRMRHLLENEDLPDHVAERIQELLTEAEQLHEAINMGERDLESSRAQHEVDDIARRLADIARDHPEYIADLVHEGGVAPLDQAMIQRFRDRIRTLSRLPGNSREGRRLRDQFEQIIAREDLSDADKRMMIQSLIEGLMYQRAPTRDRRLQEVDMQDPEVRRAFERALADPELEGNPYWQDYVELVQQQYYDQNSINVGDSPRSTDPSAVTKTNRMRADFIAGLETGAVLPEAAEAVTQHLQRALDVHGSEAAVVEAGLAVWIDPENGARSDSSAGSVLWPADQVWGVWRVDHIVEIQHGGTNQVHNYYPVPQRMHSIKSIAMNIFGYYSTRSEVSVE
jgi:uncharacterized protein YukE